MVMLPVVEVDHLLDLVPVTFSKDGLRTGWVLVQVGADEVEVVDLEVVLVTKVVVWLLVEVVAVVVAELVWMRFGSTVTAVEEAIAKPSVLLLVKSFVVVAPVGVEPPFSLSSELDWPLVEVGSVGSPSTNDVVAIVDEATAGLSSEELVLEP
jgi:predicted benzoate:H+ symporter BenE